MPQASVWVSAVLFSFLVISLYIWGDFRTCEPHIPPWGYVTEPFGRALVWHSRGQRFDPAYLHQEKTVIHRMAVFFLLRRFRERRRRKPSASLRSTSAASIPLISTKRKRRTFVRCFSFDAEVSGSPSAQAERFATKHERSEYPAYLHQEKTRASDTVSDPESCKQKSCKAATNYGLHLLNLL